MLLQTLCRRVLVARRSETLLEIMYAAVLSRIAAEAAQWPRMKSVMPTSRGSRPRLCVSWPSGLLCGQLDRISGQEQRSFGSIRSSRMPWLGMRATRAMCAFESSYYVTYFKKAFQKSVPSRPTYAWTTPTARRSDLDTRTELLPTQKGPPNVE